MKYVDEFRNRDFVKALAGKIKSTMPAQEIRLMEVCGTHTMAISRNGLRETLPAHLRLLSGPGCPVCVTPTQYLDRAIAYIRQNCAIIATFGDMMRVPGSTTTLEKEKTRGADIHVVYSPLEAIQLARDNPVRDVIFLGVGFETTAPAIAVSIQEAKKNGLKNFFVLCGHKLVPPALRALLDSPNLKIDGFILPGHVSTVIGPQPYGFIAKEFRTPAVITGFEPADILKGILMLVRQIADGRSEIETQYTRSVYPEGNPHAQMLLDETFSNTDSTWRGLGGICESGLKIKERFREFDAETMIEVEVEKTREMPGCICGEILCGVKTPYECPGFGKLCTPENPVGPCMVSSEGTCAAYYKYGVFQS